ncbi:MAG: SixA phosphatase family protein [Planctomycetota bacterium]|jgi:phosphohistidine phosphatase
MKTLLVMRHAKSSHRDATLSDHDRPLNDRGRRDAPRMGRLLADETLAPEIIVSSTARRARATAVLVAETLGLDRSIELREDLYHAAAEDCVEVLAELPAEIDCVLIVGHNPTFEDLVHVLTGRAEMMPTAAIARVELDIEQWSDLFEDPRGRLLAVWRPREVD